MRTNNHTRSYKYILYLIFTFVFNLRVFAQKEIVSGKINTIVIDAGHGGRDPGAIGKIAREKDITLAVALKLGKLIAENHPDVNVIYTRSEDKFVELYQRAEIANKAKADLFISIHVNSTTKKDANGVEFWVLGLHKADENLEVAKKENAALQFEQNIRTNYGFDPNSPEGNIIMTMKQSLYLDKSIQFAKAVESKFTVDETQVVRGTKQAGFIVLYKTAMPSVLLEIGFASNPDEEQYISNDYGQSKIAGKIATAFSEFKRNYEKGHTQELKPRIDATSNQTSTETSFSSSLQTKTTKPIPASNTSNSKIKIEEDEPVVQVIPKDTKPVAPNSSSLMDPSGKNRTIIDEEAERYSSIETKPSIPVTTTQSTGKIRLEEPSTVSKNQSSIIPAKLEKTTPTAVSKVEQKEPTKSTKDANLLVKEQTINTNASKTTDRAQSSSSTSGKPNAPSYVKDASIKEEILDNAKEVDKVFRDIPTNNMNGSNVAANQAAPIQFDKSKIQFKVQVKASSIRAKSTDVIFSIGEKVEESLEGGLYKYLVGSFSEESKARQYQEQIKAKGIPDAFVVKYSNGVRIH